MLRNIQIWKVKQCYFHTPGHGRKLITNCRCKQLLEFAIFECFQDNLNNILEVGMWRLNKIARVKTTNRAHPQITFIERLGLSVTRLLSSDLTSAYVPSLGTDAKMSVTLKSFHTVQEVNMSFLSYEP